MTSVTAANTGPYQCFADNVRADSSALWVITVRDPGECYVCIMFKAICNIGHEESTMICMPEARGHTIRQVHMLELICITSMQYLCMGKLKP